MGRRIERQLRALHPAVGDRTIRNHHAVEKVLHVLWPKRFELVWLVRPQVDGTVWPRQSVCYALGALWPTSTRRLRSADDYIRAYRAAQRANYDHRYHHGDVALLAFARRLCELKPRAAEAIRLVRTWHRRYRRLNNQAREMQIGGRGIIVPADAESLATDACAG